MKKTHYYVVLYSIFLLLLVSTTSFSANGFSIEINEPITPDYTYVDTLGDSLKDVNHEVTYYLTQAACKNHSYDPHNQLLYYTELEAGRVTFYVDAYYGQALKLQIENGLGEELTIVDMSSVDRNYLYVDLAAWECGKYYVVLTNAHGEVQEYSFVID